MTDATKTPPSQAIKNAANQVKKTPTEASDGCYICEQELWISVFFDEPAHDARTERGTEKLSNIGKLFHGHAEDYGRGIYRLYFNGLGVAFSEPNIARRKTGTEIAIGSSKDAVVGKVKDAGKTFVLSEHPLTEIWKDLKSAKGWAWEFGGVLAKIGIEEVSSLRDRESVSKITLSGVKTRVANAVEKIDQIIKDQTERVRHINVAVFGSGMGGAMARLFINRLLTDKVIHRADMLYPTPQGDAIFEVRFLGLFDCMSATLDGGPLIDFAAGAASFGLATLRIDGPMGISDKVQQVVHYVAGHELRVTRRIDSVAKSSAGRVSEVVLPGNHEDIVGNYAEEVESRSNQLSRVALMRMHADAYSAGIPIMSMARLETMDFRLRNLMQVSAAMQVHEGMPALSLDRLLQRYEVKASGSSLEAQLIEHMSHFISWMRLRFETPKHPGRPPQAAYDLLEAHYNRLTSLTTRVNSTYTMSTAERRLYHVWDFPLKQDDYEVAIFDNFIHDELYRSKLDLVAADWLTNGYFKVRGIDESDEFD